MMQRVICGLILGLIAPALAAADDGTIQRESKGLQGKWKAISFEHKGQAAPKEEAQQAEFTVEAGGKATLAAKSGKRKLSYVIDPTKAPKAIDLTYEDESGPQGTKQYGIYK